MAFKVFTAGEVLTAANVNDYLMEQTNIVCTSASRPSSPNEGMVVYETDTDVVSIYTGSAWITALTHQGWTDYSGTLAWTATSINPAIGNGTISSAYARWGRMIVYRGRITMGSTTTFGTGGWIVSLPVNCQSTIEDGGASVDDDSTAANNQPAVIRLSTSTTAVFYVVGGTVSPTVPITWATNDILRWCITYQGSA